MNYNEFIIMGTSLLTLGGVGFLIARFPRTTLRTKHLAILVDTSVIIDGRITALAATGFIGGSLVIPRSVIGELQLLADGSDSEKRARARRGLDIVSELQHVPGIEVKILQDSVRANEGVDNRLLALAKRHNAAICTLDYNLNKVAVVEGIQVLNINELAQSLRMSHIPGERLVVELTQKGQDSHQAVGHLADGTMVVVEQASSRIGQTIEAEVIRSLQTVAGRMMFAKAIDKGVKQAARPEPAARVQKAAQQPARRQQKPRQQQSPQTTRRNEPSQHESKPSAHQTQPQASPTRPQEEQQSQPAAKPYRNPRTRRPGARDREAALINLVEQQK